MASLRSHYRVEGSLEAVAAADENLAWAARLLAQARARLAPLPQLLVQGAGWVEGWA